MGRRASILERKEHFRRLLLAHPTKVTRVHAALAAKANHRMPQNFFLDLLEEHFSDSEARRQLDTAIQCGRFAELFGYDADTGELYLETEGAEAPATLPTDDSG